MAHHNFEFVPSNKASGWSIYEGSPSIWWYVRLTHDEPVLLSNESDARQLESDVRITIGTDTPIGKMPYTGEGSPTSKWGYLLCTEDASGHSDSVSLRIAVSPANFDRILASVRNGAPPTITAGFGPSGAFENLAGPLTVDETTDVYHWDNKTQSHVVVESCEFKFSRAALDTEVPEQSEESGAILRGLGAAFTVVWNVIAVLITLAVFNATNSKFETAAVSVLALIYLMIKTFGTEFPRLLAQMELSQLTRFYQLRTLVGVPAEEAETKHLQRAQKLFYRRDAKFFINLSGSAIIGLIVSYKLIMLAF
jgi:hypothetical protein